MERDSRPDDRNQIIALYPETGQNVHLAGLFFFSGEAGMKKRQGISFISSCFFGYLCIALSVFISVEVIMRKLFSASLQGADELGGYVLAITSVIAFGVALIGNSHIRIDLVHYKFPS